MKDIRDTGVPEFKTLEEEKEYWEARGPLAEGHKGTINRPKSKQKRSSFLAVRLTGEELTRLRDIATKQGVGPSTFARIVLTSEINKDILPRRVALEELLNAMISRFSKEDMEKAESIFEEIAIGDSENPALLVFSGERRKWEELVSLVFERLLGVQVMPTENENYQKIIEIAKTKTNKEEIKR